MVIEMKPTIYAKLNEYKYKYKYKYAYLRLSSRSKGQHGSFRI